ncbi:MAG TPA: hypothetical protein VGQ68_09945 [Gaiellaceae bacterium]|nr:hypothetical protein [Gaiellaceae bacterium]
MRLWLWIGTTLVLGLVAGGLGGWFAHGEQRTVTRARDIAPPGSQVLDMRVLRSQTGPTQLAVAWRRGDPNDYPTEFGLTIWQRAGVRSPWRRLYERRIPVSKLANIHDLRLRTADVTRDGREDLLVFEDLDGSAGVYVYRLFTTDGGNVRQIAARLSSEDDSTVIANYGELVSYDGVGKDPKSGSYIHCCPRYWRRTVQRWNGERLVTAKITRTKSRPSPYRY